MFADRTNWNFTPNRLSEALARHRTGGKPLLDLSVSNPTECGFQYATHAIMRALCSPRTIEYRPDPKGLEVARKAVSAYYAEKNTRVSPDKILLTTSTSEAYSFIFRLLCNSGDELLVPSPSYPLFDFLAEIQDVRLKRYPLIYDHGWHIDLHALKQTVTEHTRGIILVHPNNPTGHFTKSLELTAINQICAERDLAIIADEVFLDFSLVPDSPLSFCTNQEVLTFTLSGISKTSGLPQMKLAWMVVSGPEKLKHESLTRLELISDTYLSLNAPVQLATPVFLEMRHGFQQQVMQRVRANLAELDRQLAPQQHCNRLVVEAGWYAVLRVPAVDSDEDVALDLLEKHDIYVHPGHFYDFPQEGHMVISLITPEAEFAEGIQRLLAIFR